MKRAPGIVHRRMLALMPDAAVAYIYGGSYISVRVKRLGVTTTGRLDRLLAECPRMGAKYCKEMYLAMVRRGQLAAIDKLFGSEPKSGIAAFGTDGRRVA